MSRKIIEEKNKALAVTRNLDEWIRVDKAAEMLGNEPDTIMNNVYDKKYPASIIRQSLLTKVWFVWKPAIYGFTTEEWAS
jgi:hypothetical protein